MTYEKLNEIIIELPILSLQALFDEGIKLCCRRLFFERFLFICFEQRFLKQPFLFLDVQLKEVVEELS